MHFWKFQNLWNFNFRIFKNHDSALSPKWPEQNMWLLVNHTKQKNAAMLITINRVIKNLLRRSEKIREMISQKKSNLYFFSTMIRIFYSMVSIPKLSALVALPFGLMFFVNGEVSICAPIFRLSNFT